MRSATLCQSWGLCALGLLSSTVYAQDAPAAHTSMLHGLQLELGLTAYQETYQETAPSGARIMQEKARMAGIQARVSTPLAAQWQARLGGEYARGDSTYTGSTASSSYGSLHYRGIDREKIQAHADILYTPAAWNGALLSAGLMARRLTDDLHQIPYGYQRINTSYFATLGAEHRFQLSNSWALQPALRYLHLIDGTQKASLDGGLRLKQDKGHGWDVSATFAQTRADGTGLRIRPFWRYLKMGASDSRMAPSGSAAYVEPKNTTRELGADLSWAF